MPISRRWVVFILRGALAIAAGIAAYTISIAAAKALFATYFVADGALALVLAWRLRVPLGSKLLLAADGVADFVVAAYFLIAVANVPVAIVALATWAIATGILELLAAAFIPRVPTLSWAIALVGMASCAVGVAIVDWTTLGEIGVLYLFAAYALLAGALFVTFGIVLARAIRPDGGRPSGRPPHA